MKPHKLLTLGDIVKLYDPYRPDKYPKTSDKNWEGFTHGIVVEITSTTFVSNGPMRPGFHHPRNVSLNLYDRTGLLYIEPLYVKKGLLIPTYVDFHISEFVIYKVATDTGYLTVPNPPDWRLINR